MTIEHEHEEATTEAGDAAATQTEGTEGGEQHTEPKSGLEALNEALDGDSSGGGDGDDGAASGQDEADEALGGDEASEAEAAADDAAQDAADRAGGEGAEAEAGKPPKTEPDHVNDPIPDDLKGRTRERMESLVKAVKERDEQIHQALSQRDELVETIRSTGATPEQFSRSLETLKLLNSGSLEEKKRGLAMLREDVNAIAAVLGEDIGDPQLLARHEDLQQAVETGEITEKHARELALRREAEQRNRQASEQSEQLTRQQQEAINAGVQSLNALEAELRDDPDYARKRVILIERLKPEFQRIPPSQWATKFAAEYAKLRLPPAGGGTQTRTADTQPLRGRQPAGGTGGVKRQPKTGLEAVNFALEELAQQGR